VVKNIFPALLFLVLAACASQPPDSPSDLCAVFDENPGWYRAARKAANKWNGNIHVPMAIMYQESAFEARAKPPMRYFLWVIPRGRASNAYGYPQALESTWANYQRAAGSRFSRRSSFSDAIDFIQWYMHQTALENSIPKNDAYRHYLNYHEGQGGFARGTHTRKQWLLRAARRVEQHAGQYLLQLNQCGKKLERKRRWLF
jgi:hypothetical protein